MRLCGRFLVWLASTNRLQLPRLQLNSSDVSPPASNGLTSSFFLLNLTLSVCAPAV